ncbi:MULTISPECIES: hypothetical protein [Comamonas]|uniref:hypothetical protein n=1 Tax=Comamonas TaxID=283 RepID=UPI00104002FC|nr:MULTISPECIES: hypothetical protein [Comamonas]TZG07381.1 hypothetical protein FZC30_19785 [Comamonas thiooxydans]UNV89223.1 hypothetical protein MP576_16585 [Comamonas sp. 7D-2evo1]UNV97478.1 hypothetical protein MPZ60_09820 [Comamonas sp. 7D-2]UNV98866.1 hypothetical protein MP579_16575 [Comamonas sp. 7D-2evo2]
MSTAAVCVMPSLKQLLGTHGLLVPVVFAGAELDKHAQPSLKGPFKSPSRGEAHQRKKALNFFKAFCHLAEQAGFEPAVGY